jgi:hypothetical protein
VFVCLFVCLFVCACMRPCMLVPVMNLRNENELNELSIMTASHNIL